MTGPLGLLETYLSGEPLLAAREGRGLHMGVHDATGIATGTISADPAMYYNIPEDHRVMVTRTLWGLDTVNDSFHTQVGVTDAGFASGTFTPLHIILAAYNGANVERSTQGIQWLPPLVASYAAGARCVTMVLSPSDTGAEITAGWGGWLESEAVIE